MSYFQLQKIRAFLYDHDGVHINLITPFDKLTVKDPKVTKNVIGFNDGHVFTFSDAKKHPEGTAELHKEISYDDFCVEFTEDVS